MKHGKSVDSDISGNVVIDYDKKGEVVRVNLYNFSFASFRENLKTLKSFTQSFKLPFLVRFKIGNKGDNSVSSFSSRIEIFLLHCLNYKD